MKDEYSNSDNTEHIINRVEVEEILGNMMLIRVDGSLEQIPATYKNKLLYEKGLYEILQPQSENERIVLRDDDEHFIAVAPTNNDSIYQIWLDNNPHPVMNRIGDAEKVLRGIYKCISEQPDYNYIIKTYKEIRKNQVRRDVVDILSTAFPQSQVIPKDEGWSIKGLFTLTWDARIFLDTGAIDTLKTYSVHGSGVSETDNPQQFLSLTIDESTINQYRDISAKVHHHIPNRFNINKQDTEEKSCPSCEITVDAYTYREERDEHELEVYVCPLCDQSWKEYDLTEKEIEFIAKADWLLNHREKLDDEAFWTVVEKYVWYNTDTVDRNISLD